LACFFDTPMPSLIRGEAPKGHTVAGAASRLNVSEFEIFRLAYENWYGHGAPASEIKRCFDVYLARSQVPMWVRAFVREIHALHSTGRLDPKSFGIPARPPATAWRVCVGGMTFAAMLLVVGLLIYLAQRSADSATAGCFFPPCY
jgi:hypothetical protein